MNNDIEVENAPSQRDEPDEDKAPKEEDEESKEPGTEAEIEAKKIPYPKGVFFIFLCEIAERFSYYGLRTVLSPFLSFVLINRHHQSREESEDNASTIYHTFAMLAYGFAVVGAYLADSHFGKFKVIFWVTIIYLIGQALLVYSTVPSTKQGIENSPQLALCVLALVIVAFGTGGIKPNVVSFGAEQFTLPDQRKHLNRYFGTFYFCINFGSMLATIITPILRGLTCFGEDCYFASFATAAGVMLLSFVVFCIGSPLYKKGEKPERNVMADFFSCIFYALRKRARAEEKKEHFLDHAKSKYGHRFVCEVKAVWRVLRLFIYFPLFWALFDQSGSRWTFQAGRMDCRVGSVDILPEQVQVLNPALVLILIPIFDYVIYPMLDKCGILTKPMQRVVFGGCLAAVAFLVCTGLEFELEKEYPENKENFPGDGQFRLDLYNGLDKGCQIALTVDSSRVPEDRFPHMFEDSHHLIAWTLADESPPSCGLEDGEMDVLLPEGKNQIIYFLKAKGTAIGHLTHNRGQIEKPEKGGVNVKFIWSLTNVIDGEFYVENEDGEKDANVKFIGQFGDTSIQTFEKPGIKKVCYAVINMEPQCNQGYDFRKGGGYTIYIAETDETSHTPSFSIVVDVEPNTIHVLWTIIQYFFITCAEIMFSITAIEFAYTQAPANMKSVLQAMNLMTTCIGNLIDSTIIVSLKGVLPSQAYEFLLFACLMLVAMFLLGWEAKRYHHIDNIEEIYEETSEGDDVSLMEYLDEQRANEGR